MSSMFIVVATAPGDSMSRLMTFLSKNGMEFSVTSNLANLVANMEPIVNEQPPSSFHEPQDNLSFSSTLESSRIASERSFNEIPGVRNLMVDVKREKIVEEELVIVEVEEVRRHEAANEDLSKVQKKSSSRKTPSTSHQETSGGDSTARKRPRRGEMEDEVAGTSETASTEAAIPKKSLIRLIKCQTCDAMVQTARRLMHVTSHLQLKLWECALCHKMCQTSLAGRKHFSDRHPTEKYIPFVEKTTPSQQKKIQEMMEKCFPGHVHDES